MLVYDTKYTFSHILTGESYSLLIIKKARDVVGREVGGGFMFGNACKN